MNNLTLSRRVSKSNLFLQCTIMAAVAMLWPGARINGQLSEIAIILPPVSEQNVTSKTDSTISCSVPLYDKIPGVEGAAVSIRSPHLPIAEMRFKSSAGVWSPWSSCDIFKTDTPSIYIAWFRGGDAIGSIQFELRAAFAGPENSLSILEAGLFVMEDEVLPLLAITPPAPKRKTFPKPDEVPPLLAITPSALKRTTFPKPQIISRQKWNAANPRVPFTPHPFFNKLTIHHSAGSAARGLAEGKKRVQSIQQLHQKVRGWNDIAYHFLIDDEGNIYQGRPEAMVGSHVIGENSGNIGICILGCYEHASANMPCNDILKPKAYKAAVKLLAWLSARYGYDLSVLLGHKDYSGKTSCPGDVLHAQLERLQADAGKLLVDDVSKGKGRGTPYLVAVGAIVLALLIFK